MECSLNFLKRVTFVLNWRTSN